MKIGLDITALHIARAGIYNYNLNLFKQLLALNSNHEFTLFNYVPLHGQNSIPFDLQSASDQVNIAAVWGPRRRRLIDWRGVDFFGGRFAAQCVDTVLKYPWRWVTKNIIRSQLHSIMTQMDVFHASEVTDFAFPNLGIVSTIHDLSPLLFPEFHTRPNCIRFKKRMKYLKEHARAIIAVSENTRQDIKKWIGIPEEKIFNVYNGVEAGFKPIDDPDEIGFVMEKYGLPKPGYILHVGTLEPRKNLTRLIEAYGAGQAQYGDDLPMLVLAGGKGWLYQEIFERVKQLGLQQRVIFTGFVADEDLPALFNNALLFVYPSLYEGFGLPILEAMACGIPVITSNVSSLPEIAGGAAVLVNPTDTHSLSRAMIDLLDNTGQRAALRQAGLERASQFSWQQTARETLVVYEKITQTEF